MAGGRAAARLERAPLLGGAVSAVTLRDAEEGLMRGGAEPPSASDRRTFGNTSASGSREGGLVDEAWRDAEARRSRGDASARRWRLVGLGAVASTALLALGMRADVATPSNAIELGDARITDGGVWGFGADGTVGASALGGFPNRERSRGDGDVGGAAGAGDAAGASLSFGQTFGSETENAVARHDASAAPEWVRRVAPFDDASFRRLSYEERRVPLESFDPVIDWTDEEAERDWPLFGSEGEARAERLDERTARVERAAARESSTDDSSFDFASATPEQRRAARVRRRARRRAEAAVAAANSNPNARRERDVVVSALSQPPRDRGWRNPAGVRATFSVNVCGVPPAVRARQAPWPACRVLLVGCPGGRSAPDADAAKPACASWDVSRALEMEADAEANGFGAFSVTTDLYGPGDEFAFALVKPGCTDAQIARALRAQGGAEPSDGSEASLDFENGGCEVRLDSGFPMGNQLTHPGSRRARCWTPRDATSDVQRVAGDALCESVGPAPAATDATFSPRELLGDKSALESAPSPFEARGDTCLLRRDAAYARGKFHRVMPALPGAETADADAAVLGSAVKTDDQLKRSPLQKVSFVWGTCDAQPRTEAWCRAPAFDAPRVAAACGVSREKAAPEAEAAPPANARAERPASSSSLGAESKDRSKDGPARFRDSDPTDAPLAEDATETPTKEEEELLPASKTTASEPAVGAGDGAAISKPREATTREEEKARAARRAAALRSKSEPFLSDDAATRAETAYSAAESEAGAERVVDDASAVASSFGEEDGLDLFGNDVNAVAEVAPGTWHSTPPTKLASFKDDAPHAVAHLLLRDGDQLFATERLPWAEFIVNGEPTRAPKQLARGDVVRLRVRAETEAEAEARAGAVLGNDAERGEPPRALDGSRLPTNRRTRVATLVVGGKSGSVRVASSAAASRVGAETDETTEEIDETDETASFGDSAFEDAPSSSSSEAEADDGDESVRRKTHMTLDGAAPGTTAHALEVTAPRAGQWMVLPPVDAPAVVVAGLGEGARAPVTVRFADEFTDESSDSKAKDDERSNGGFVGDKASDRRVAPGGDANGVFAKVNGADQAVNARRDRVVSVWTREETMQIARAGPAARDDGGLGARDGKESVTAVTVKDGDKLRVKVRAGPSGSGSGDKASVRLAVFVGDRRVGTVSVATAATAEEAEAAGSALDERLREARKEARKEADAEASAKNKRRVSARVGAAVVADADEARDDDAKPSAAEDSLTPLITGREITAEEMLAAPSGSTRVVLAGSRVSLPSAGFMTVAGVLPSAELRLLVHALQ